MIIKMQGFECLRGVMVNARNIEIVIRKFDLQSCYYIHFKLLHDGLIVR